MYRYSAIVLLYLCIGVMLIIGGVAEPVPGGPVDSFADVTGTNIDVDDRWDDSGGSTGLVTGMLGSIESGVDTLFGGTVIAAVAKIVMGTFGMFTYPLIVAEQLNFPWQIQLLMTLLTTTMIFAAARVVRSSI